MSVRRTTAAVALLLISLTLAPAASAASRAARADSCWQQLAALFARWTGGETTQSCVPSEVNTCGVDPPQ
jgi:hypothetical protein